MAANDESKNIASGGLYHRR